MILTLAVALKILSPILIVMGAILIGEWFDRRDAR